MSDSIPKRVPGSGPLATVLSMSAEQGPSAPKGVGETTGSIPGAAAIANAVFEPACAGQEFTDLPRTIMDAHAGHAEWGRRRTERTSPI